MTRNENILQEIKQLIGIESDDTVFDTEVTIHINSAFMTLNQLGVGPAKMFMLKTGNEVWGDFISEENYSDAIASYIHFYVRLAFDPPSTSYVIASYERQLTEISQRLMMQAEEHVIGDDDNETGN